MLSSEFIQGRIQLSLDGWVKKKLCKVSSHCNASSAESIELSLKENNFMTVILINASNFCSSTSS